MTTQKEIKAFLKKNKPKRYTTPELEKHFGNDLPKQMMQMRHYGMVNYDYIKGTKLKSAYRYWY